MKRLIPILKAGLEFNSTTGMFSASVRSALFESSKNPGVIIAALIISPETTDKTAITSKIGKLNFELLEDAKKLVDSLSKDDRLRFTSITKLKNKKISPSRHISDASSTTYHSGSR